jgi:hypothetical protein
LLFCFFMCILLNKREIYAHIHQKLTAMWGEWCDWGLVVNVLHFSSYLSLIWSRRYIYYWLLTTIYYLIKQAHFTRKSNNNYPHLLISSGDTQTQKREGNKSLYLTKAWSMTNDEVMLNQDVKTVSEWLTTKTLAWHLTYHFFYHATTPPNNYSKKRKLTYDCVVVADWLLTALLLCI